MEPIPYEKFPLMVLSSVRIVSTPYQVQGAWESFCKSLYLINTDAKLYRDAIATTLPFMSGSRVFHSDILIILPIKVKLF